MNANSERLERTFNELKELQVGGCAREWADGHRRPTAGRKYAVSWQGGAGDASMLPCWPHHHRWWCGTVR